MKKRFIVYSVGIVFLLASVPKVKDTLSDNAKVIHKIPTSQKLVAITIDDGPHPKTTPEILEVLKEKGVKATFFVLGDKVEKSPALLVQEVADGHEIGNHGYSHKYLARISTDKIEPEIDRADEIISKIAPAPTLFRPPGGEYNHTVLEVAGRHHYTVILWSIDTNDWRSPPVTSVVEEVLKNIKPGSIILFHDGNYPLPTAKALDIIIDRLKQQGYEFVTVSQLLEYYEVRPSISVD